jgi:hypothetical protein
MQSLCALLVATSTSLREAPRSARPTPNRPPKVVVVPPAPATSVPSWPEVVTAAPTRPDEPLLSVADLDRLPPTWPKVAVIEPTRPWVLPDKTWRAIAESRWNLDVSFEPGHEYVGVRVVLPFGS